jgi:TonB-linked SusC/RagA family outer membrane protein
MMRWHLACGLVALSLPVATVRAQQPAPQGDPGRITGAVTSAESGEPIQGATITVLGTRQGAITNPQGRYTVTIAPGLYKVRVNMIGFGPIVMDSVPVTAGSSATANFQLVKQALQLAQVVVVGYGSQEKRDVTGAVSSVKAQDIKQTPTTNAIEAIKGKVPGVDIVTTGFKPGDGVRVRIRGQRSIKASNDPLYVLDGVPMAGGIGDLNPADIESIEVLKDASATAIYGSRGANGVVLITSTKGSAGRTKISYDTYYGAENVAKKMRVFNGPEFAEYKREAYRASGDYAKWCGTAAQCDEGDKNMFYVEEYNAFKAGISTDWQDLILRQGGQASHQLSITGGNDRTQYSVSGNMVNDQGIILGQDFNRKSMRVNLETQANSRLRFGGSALVLRSNQNIGRGDGLYGEVLADAPLSVPFDSAGNVIFKPTPDSQRDNPLSDVANQINRTQRTRAFGTMYGTAKLAEGLDFRVNFGPDLSFSRNGTFVGAQTQANQGSGAQAAQKEERIFDFTLDNILTYKKSLGADHKVDFTALYSIERNTTDTTGASVSGLPYETQQFYNLGSGSSVSGVGSDIRQWSLQSYMGRLNYTFKDKYLITLTTRIDGSSRLAEGRKYATFPSVALGYRAVDETPVGPISSLKFRGSYGITGNTSVNPYQTQGGLTRTAYSWGNTGAFGFRPGALANEDLGWEKTAQYDVGADFGFFHDRLTGTVDGYVATTSDLLMDRQLPPSTGYQSITQNIGQTRNTGFELALTHQTLNGWHGIRWSNDITLSVAKNKIVSLTYGKVDDPGNKWFIGQPINGGSNSVWYDYKMLGIWQLADSLEAKRYGQTPGQIRVQDVDGDGKINTNDLQILGNTYPDWAGSFNTRVEWKRFDVAAQVVTRQGFMVQNQFRTDNSTLAGRYNGIWVNYWTPTNPGGTDPRPNKNQESPVYSGVRAYEDGSFTRLRNVTLGFTVPPNLTKRIGSDRVRIYGTAQNPVTWTNFTGLDPEGRTSAGTPAYKMYLIGATFGF